MCDYVCMEITKSTAKKSRSTKTTKQRPQEPASLPVWLRIVAQAAEARAEQLQAQAEAAGR